MKRLSIQSLLVCISLCMAFISCSKDDVEEVPFDAADIVGRWHQVKQIEYSSYDDELREVDYSTVFWYVDFFADGKMLLERHGSVSSFRYKVVGSKLETYLEAGHQVQINERIEKLNAAELHIWSEGVFGNYQIRIYERVE